MSAETSPHSAISCRIVVPFVRVRSVLDNGAPWFRLLVALFLGAIAALAFQPVSLIPVLPMSLIGLLWLVHGCTRARQIFFMGWAFGTGHFAIGLYWIGNAFMVHADRHGVLGVPAVLGLAIVLGLYCGVLAWLYRTLVPGRRITIAAVLVYAALWALLEWVRGWAFTGFPWNAAGAIWTVSDSMMQGAAVGGVYFLSLLTIAGFSLPAAMADDEAPTPGRILGALFLSAAVFLSMYVAGYARLSGEKTTFVDGVHLRLVQPNIPQGIKWKPERRGEHIAKQLDLSLRPAADGALEPTHILWAETAVPYVLSREPELLRVLSHAAPEGGALITGGIRGNENRFWNSLFAIGSNDIVLAHYDKEHLVPFGEYVPFSDFLPLGKLTAGAGNFTAGTGGRSMTIRGLPLVSALICYEIIFPGSVVNSGRPGPAWILNITNDAWYGISAGPYQHFAAARLRAVEEGLPVVRVANTGISGVLDGFGRVVRSLPLGTEGTLDAGLPEKLPPGLYSKWGNMLVVVLCLLIVAAGRAALIFSEK